MTNPSDPFRFDDRSGHYGAGQADLAPVSPVAALPRLDPADRPVDPMGASPDDRPTGDFQKPDPRDADDGAGVRTQAEASTAVQMTGSTDAVQNTGPAAAPMVDAAPPVTLSAATPAAAPEGQPAQNTTLTLSGEAAVNARAAAGELTIQGSGSPVALLAPAEPVDQGPAGFAATAMQMDQMMAEMASRFGASAPWTREDDEDDSPAPGPATAIGDAQDRLDALFDGLRGDAGGGASQDPFTDARSRIDDLLGRSPADEADVESPPTGGGVPAAFDAARARLDDLLDRTGTDGDAPGGPASGAASPSPLDAARDRLDALADDDREADGPAALPPPSALLAQLFDGDHTPPFAGLGMDDLSERFGDLGDFVPDLPGPAFGPGGWDDLPDFG